ncbi:MAG: DUF6544 family protein [Myxococcota bacterium]
MSLRERFFREIGSGAALPAPVGEPVTEADIPSLPEPARRYLRFMGVVGRPLDRAFSVGFSGRFRLRPDGPWMACEAWQYSLARPISRVFHIRIRMAGILPVVARDTYLDGRGRMLVRAFDRIGLEDATGPALDVGELVTWLNDAVLLAPSFLLTPAVSFQPVDVRSFGLTVEDAGNTASARVSVGADGAVRAFETTDRFLEEAGTWTRTRWTTPITAWGTDGGRPVPRGGRAIWHRAEGEFCYAELEPMPGTLVFPG